MNKNNLILITGAAGMIGSGVVRYLNDQGYYNLLLVDDLKTGDKWKNLVGKKFLDLFSKHALFDRLKEDAGDVDAILHLGACSHTVETDADYLLENNFRFTTRLAEWALSRNKRFIYASSAATYGDGSNGFSDDEDRIEELRPLNMYAFSKQLADLWMKREGAFKQAVGLKYFNVFGPNEYHKGRMRSMIMKMMSKAKDDGVIHLYKSNNPKFADGGQMRDFIYVKDAVRMTCNFLEPNAREIGGLYNIGRGAPETWNTLAKALFSSLGKENAVQYIPMPPELDGQYQNYTCADMQKFHKIFSPVQKPIEADVQDYVQNYLMKDARW